MNTIVVDETGTEETSNTETPDATEQGTPPQTTLVSDPALQEAIYWMNDNGMTRYDTVEMYRPFDTLQRQEAAKIFTLFRNMLIQGIPEPDPTNTCLFDDLGEADPTLVPFIRQSCQLQILR
jgi:hypothetical protein